MASLFFANITQKEIELYVKKNKKTVLTTVGSYKIEENSVYKFLRIIEGDLETILGFPIEFLAFPLENSIWLLTSIIEVMESLVISVKFNLLIILMPNLNLKAKNYMNFTKLNPNIILKTGFFGVFMGIVTVWGWSKSYETLLWIGIGFTTTIYL